MIYNSFINILNDGYLIYCTNYIMYVGGLICTYMYVHQIYGKMCLPGIMRMIFIFIAVCLFCEAVAFKSVYCSESFGNTYNDQTIL